MDAALLNNTFIFNLRIARFDLPPQAVYPVVITGTLMYLFSVLGNITILALIVTQPRLHKPMFYIMFSLPLADLVGITACLPRILVDIVTQTNMVYYPTCVMQGFLLHLSGTSELFVLAAMSIDRYIAICKPLRYHSIMNPSTVCGIIALVWGVDVVLIVVLFALQVRLTKCKSYIYNVFCDNVSLIRLSCGDDLAINNIYSLFITGFAQGVSLAIQLFCYASILKACISRTQTDARSKAVNTCMAQLISFFLFELVASFMIISYRFENLPPNAQKISGILMPIMLPLVNPIIYGMKTSDIRNTFLIVLKKKQQKQKVGTAGIACQNS
ncbi:olfactory receptor 5H19-like [Trichomycterus rosablanca]|uniref:olfactory receptor 5H19-like n=1 Tax=Trichomycterus rosablanca TaxID=2290929 RepID=UPI002F36070A